MHTQPKRNINLFGHDFGVSVCPINTGYGSLVALDFDIKNGHPWEILNMSFSVMQVEELWC